jgi:hypothetical protein
MSRRPTTRSVTATATIPTYTITIDTLNVQLAHLSTELQEIQRQSQNEQDQSVLVTLSKSASTITSDISKLVTTISLLQNTTSNTNTSHNLDSRALQNATKTLPALHVNTNKPATIVPSILKFRKNAQSLLSDGPIQNAAFIARINEFAISIDDDSFLKSLDIHSTIDQCTSVLLFHFTTSSSIRLPVPFTFSQGTESIQKYTRRYHEAAYHQAINTAICATQPHNRNASTTLDLDQLQADSLKLLNTHIHVTLFINGLHSRVASGVTCREWVVQQMESKLTVAFHEDDFDYAVAEATAHNNRAAIIPTTTTTTTSIPTINPRNNTIPCSWCQTNNRGTHFHLLKNCRKGKPRTNPNLTTSASSNSNPTPPPTTSSPNAKLLTYDGSSANTIMYQGKPVKCRLCGDNHFPNNCPTTTSSK